MLIDAVLVQKTLLWQTTKSSRPLPTCFISSFPCLVPMSLLLQWSSSSMFNPRHRSNPSSYSIYVLCLFFTIPWLLFQSLTFSTYFIKYIVSLFIFSSLSLSFLSGLHCTIFTSNQLAPILPLHRPSSLFNYCNLASPFYPSVSCRLPIFLYYHSCLLLLLLFLL